MKKYVPLIFLSLLSSSCYKQMEIEGFDKKKWRSHWKECSTYRLEKANLIIQHSEVLLGSTQNNIENLLGKAREHELYERNQKLFYYRLTPPNHCEMFAKHSFLEIRFNALGKASLFQIIYRDAE